MPDTNENFDTNAEAENEQQIAIAMDAPVGNVRPIKPANAAQAIMADPAGAAGEAPLPTLVGPTDEATAVLNTLPGLVGGINEALRDHVGKALPFVLMVFADGGGVRGNNFADQGEALRAVKSLVHGWDMGMETETHIPVPVTPEGRVPDQTDPGQDDTGHVTH